MRRLLLISLLISAAAAADGEATSTRLLGQWFRLASSQHPGTFAISFRADHSFDYVGGDAHGAGKWLLHDGNNLELIYHYDYDPKPISDSSKRSWIVIYSISKNRMQVRWDLSPSGQLSSFEVWTKQR
jgi:hypothetical protein